LEIYKTIIVPLLFLCAVTIYAQTEKISEKPNQAEFNNIYLHSKKAVLESINKKGAIPVCSSPSKFNNSFSRAVFKVIDNPVSPPRPPSNLKVKISGLQNISATWDPSPDGISGGITYVFGIGREAGKADIHYWQSTGSYTSFGITPHELHLKENDTIYVSVYSINSNNEQSDPVTSGPHILKWIELGNQNNEITLAMSGEWRSGEKDSINMFLSRMMPIIKEIYGPPSTSYTVTLVKDSAYKNTNVFIPSANEIHMFKMFPQLLTHEMLHAFRGSVLLASDSLWRYDATFSGFEESFAQGISYACMNKYVELYPAGPIVTSASSFGSSYDFDYDFQNTNEITTTDFWSDTGGTLIYWVRYELGAAAIHKILLENLGFGKAFNNAYYNALNNNHAQRVTRELIVSLIASIVSTVEGRPVRQWIDRQRIFDCRVNPGHKIWTNTQHYTGWGGGYIIFHTVFYYETFSNGSDWAYWDNSLSRYVYYNSNGSTGTGILKDNSGKILEQKNLRILPADNPPVLFSYGFARASMLTNYDTQPWPADDPQRYFLGIKKFGLYWLELNFGNTKSVLPRVMGDTLKSTVGVFGTILNSSNGEIYFKHENFPDESPMIVKDGVFCGQRSWASLPNIKTGSTDSNPGRVYVKYIDSSGKVYSDQRNIDLGSNAGNQLFLFNLNEMKLIDSVYILSGSVSNLSFGDVAPGSSKPGYITIKNPSVRTITIDSIYTSTHFFSSANISRILAMNDSVRINITFSPLASLSYKDTLYISCNGKTLVKKIPLSGNGLYVAGNETGGDLIPKKYELSQNFPNPFNPATRFNFSMPKQSYVSLSVYNILGQEVAALVNEIKPAGYYSISWNASKLPSGIYFVKMEALQENGAGAFKDIKKIILLK